MAEGEFMMNWQINIWKCKIANREVSQDDKLC